MGYVFKEKLPLDMYLKKNYHGIFIQRDSVGYVFKGNFREIYIVKQDKIYEKSILKVLR